MEKKYIDDPNLPEPCKSCVFLHKGIYNKDEYTCANPLTCLDGVQDEPFGLD